MARTYTEYKAIVEFLVNEQKISIDEAVKISNVPLIYADRIRTGLDPHFVDIRAPSLLVDDSQQNTPLIVPFGDDEPQPYLDSYLSFLENQRGWNEDIVANLKNASKKIIERCPSPKVDSGFQCRGLVVGHVQSGKTANMAAVIARAADHGYKLVVVFAGIYNDLRSQTQDRLDQDITGKSEEIVQELLVAHDESVAPWRRYTSAGLEGDFKPGSISFNMNAINPSIAVIKKHHVVLERFKNWLTDANVDLSNFPVLIIDDEADQASINTKYDRDEVSKTNLRIRELVGIFPKCTYIGFTATPFANVLIDTDEVEDLYPKDFIAVLEEPKGYFGARQLFGLGLSPSSLSPESSSEPDLNIVRFLDHVDLDELDNLSVDGEAAVLSRAILSFLLSCAARLKRGDRGHFSMLVHPSHEKAVHEVFRQVIEKELAYLKQAMIHPAKFQNVLNLAKKIWDEDFIKTSADALVDDKHIFSFEEIWKFCRSVVEEVDVIVLNSGSEDELYYKSEVPKRYIVVGGNRLSRGLTLEGLSVSLFLRNSNQYDTLLQMGRWFGYREGYADLTRIFVSESLADSFADLARVELELREDLKQYSLDEDSPTPLEIKPKIRAHPTLAVTSALKMGAGTRVNISLQHSRIETVAFPLNQITLLQENQLTASKWIQSLGAPEKDSNTENGYFWLDVTASKVIELLRSYHFSREARKTNRDVLISYILRQLQHNELANWDVCLPRGNPKTPAYSWCPSVTTNKVNRAKLKSTSKRNSSIRVLSSPSDINSWRAKFGRQASDPRRGGIFLYVIDKNSEGKNGQNKLFGDSPKDKAVDVIGLVLVFPESVSNATVEYVTQQDI